MSRVTVLIPNYNNGPFLKECIDSILSQTYQDFELLIVDDGSVDNSVEVIKSYTDKRITLIEKAENSGTSDTMNIGLDNIQTEFMVRTDADDISAPDRIEKMVLFMDANPNVNVCSTNFQLFGKEDNVWRWNVDPDYNKARSIFEISIGNVAIYRMDLFNNKNYRYNGKYVHMEDQHMFFMFKHDAVCSNIDEELYLYRRLGHNVTMKHVDSKEERVKGFYKDCVLPELQIENSDRNAQLHWDLSFQSTNYRSRIKDLKSYYNLLLSQNQKLKIYPQKALNKYLKESTRRTFFKVADKSFKDSLVFMVNFGFTFPRIKYSISKLLKK